MTPLRQRMLDAMQVRGFAQRTQECYCEPDPVSWTPRSHEERYPRTAGSVA